MRVDACTQEQEDRVEEGAEVACFEPPLPVQGGSAEEEEMEEEQGKDKDKEEEGIRREEKMGKEGDKTRHKRRSI